MNDVHRSYIRPFTAIFRPLDGGDLRVEKGRYAPRGRQAGRDQQVHTVPLPDAAELGTCIIVSCLFHGEISMVRTENVSVLAAAMTYERLYYVCIYSSMNDEPSHILFTMKRAHMYNM